MFHRSTIPHLVLLLAALFQGVPVRAQQPPSGIAPLLRDLTSENRNVSMQAARTFRTLESHATEAVPALAGMLRARHPHVREHAADLLAGIGPPAEPAIPALLLALDDTVPFVCGKAAYALSRIGAAAVPSLSEALSSGSANARWCAAIALWKMGRGAENAVPVLARALTDSIPDVRWSSAFALGAIGPRAGEAVPALRSRLSDSDQDVRWAACLALNAIDPAALTTPPSLESTITAIDRRIPALMEALHVPGVSIALIANRRVAWSRSYGLADVRYALPVTDSTLFEACSMTKPLFAYGVLKLAEMGRLDLDRPLASYMPDRPAPLQPELDLITARMVLSHTTGLPNWRKGEEERDGPLPVLHAPGTRFGYSGEGMLYLQQVVERIMDEPIETTLHRIVLAPMGLRQTSIVWTPAIDARLAAGHDTAGAFLQKTRYEHANAAYTLYTTAREYAVFLTEIMNPDRSAPHSLSATSITKMLAHEVAVQTREPIERPGSALGREVFWGLGWSVNTTWAGDIVHHSGANRSGFRCFSQFTPSRGTGIVIMTNGLNGGDLWSRLIGEIGDY